ncbi:MAG: dephospho-CoA kinase [Mycobacteriaceae bacterium]
MLRVGLTGGIGAGKSTVSRRWAERGAVVVDADLIAREVVAVGTPGLEQLVDEFGPDIVVSDGTLNRPALAAKAFGDHAVRSALNGILHPLIGARTAELVAAAPADAVVVQDIPLLVEGGLAPMFHLVVVVHAEVEARVARLVGQRGMSDADARARISAQASDAERRAAADVWLDNSGAPVALESVVDELWIRRLQPFERNLRLRIPVREESAVLVPADDEWAAQGERLAARLRMACGGRALRVDHIGSTAVAGLAATDVLDFQVTVVSVEDAAALEQPLADAGFPPRPSTHSHPPKPGGPGPWAERLHSGADPARPVNVHVRVQDSPGQRFALLLRDWLRVDADARLEYLQFKRDAVRATDTSDAYAAATGPWRDAAYPRAVAWAERTGWTPGP